MKDKQGNFIHNTDKVNHDIQEFLGRFGSKGPFCLSVSFKAPHEQDGHPPRFIVQERFKELYKDVNIPVPVTADPKYWNSFPIFSEQMKMLHASDGKHCFQLRNYTRKMLRIITGLLPV